MTTRRSLRIAGEPPAAGSNQGYADTPRLGKRKIRGSDDEEDPKAKKKAPINKAESEEVQDQTKIPDLVNDEQQLVPPAPKDAFSSLSTEIQLQILANMDPKRLISFACTSKHNYALVMPMVNKNIAIHADRSELVCKVISRLEPLLSITQQRKLWKEGRSKAQRPKFHRLLDPNVIPLGAQYVRQMTVGVIGPAVKYRQNVMRKLEKVLKNLSNLEVLNTTELSQSMAYSIGALKCLKALRIQYYCADLTPKCNNIAPMSQLRDLKHLSISTSRCQCITPVSRDETLQSTILNSSSTLERLEVYPFQWDSSIDADQEDQVPVLNADLINDGFPVLKSLVLYGTAWRPANRIFFINDRTYFSSIASKVNFLQLRKLHLGHLEGGQLRFFKSLKKSFGSAERRDIQLRQLTLDMYPDQLDRDAYETEMNAMYRFIASFDTLTSLEIYDHNRFHDSQQDNPGLSPRLKQAIIVHKGLESLRFRYPCTGYERPLFSTPDIGVFTNNLPQLRDLALQVGDGDFEGMARAFSYAKNLEFLTCGAPGTRSQGLVTTVEGFYNHLIAAFLHIAGDNKEFVWEKTYRLKQITINKYLFSVGSDLKPGNSIFEKISTDGKSVWVREESIPKPREWEGPSEWASQIMKSV